VTGSHPIPGMGSATSFTGWRRVQGDPADGRRLGSSQAVAFDEAAVEAVLGARETDDRSDGRSRNVCDRRRQRSLVQRRRTRKRCVVASSRGSSDAVSSERRQRGNGQCARERPKLAPRRQAWVSRGWIVARRSGATRASPTASSPHGGSAAEVGGVATALTPVRADALGSRAMARMLVSNVGCRSWREASSSFHRGPREGAEAVCG
jgi:hypothetical protein